MKADGHREDHALRSPARQEGDRLVEAQARGQVQAFLYELMIDIPNYRTVAGLSSQITQEYRGRCVLELLQNAHDALGDAGPDDARRISFVLVTEPEPILLIANSGQPFRRRDFKGICQLGQSPKDPNESVGNKGLGFQSVLEVTTRPRIWSTAAERGGPEFAFGFDPAGTMRLVEQAVAEIENGSRHPAATPADFLNWSEDVLREYRKRRRSGEAPDAASEARKNLSPYSIPLPIRETPPEVADLLDAGYATVIRLPLDGGRTGAASTEAESVAVQQAVASIRDQLDRLDASAVVFLPDVRELTIDIDGRRRSIQRIVDSDTDLPGARPAREQVLLIERSSGSAPPASPPRPSSVRQPDSPPAPPHGLRADSSGGPTRAPGRGVPYADRVRTTPAPGPAKRFRVWTRSLGGDNDPAEAERIQGAVRHLPGRWPEVRQVEVGVTVEDTASPTPGKFVVFLPTEVATGTGAHINAPFYGSLDRRQINFEDEYNALLLEYAMDLALDVATELAEGPTEGWRARAVIDLLASTDAPAGGDRPALMDRMRQRAEERGHDIESTELVLCDNGWQVAERARIMLSVPGGDSIGEDRWRENAGFAVVSSELNGRRKEVEALVDCLGGSAAPTPVEWAATIEQLAGRIQSNEIEISWNVFLNSVLAVLPRVIQSEPRTGAADPLSNAKFLPTQDERLLSASGTAQIFFQPRRGFDDAAEFVGQIPDALRDRIAFLHRDVRTHEGPQQQNTEVQGFLNGRNGRFVQSFGREDLLRDVVIPALPELPARHGTPDAQRCSEILGWTLLLDVAELEGVSDLRQRLPVACHGGWLPAGEAVFGPGWQGRHGEHVRILADSLTDGSSRLLEKALLPPRDQRWGLNAAAPDRLLEQAGVIDGLPTEIAEPVSFTMSARYRDRPRVAPAGTPQDAWDEWLGACDNELTPEIKSSTSYRLEGIRLAPEIHSLQDLQDEARHALSHLILSSLGKWDDAWESARLARPRYPTFARQITSPLKHWLTTLPWLHDNQVDPRPLCQRWFVPESLLRGQRGRFAHLAPLSLELAHRLGEDPELLATLTRLGLNVYPTEDDRTGPQLLEALADAHEKDEMPAGGFDVFLGQVRHAWRHLDPDAELPERFLVWTKARKFEIKTAEDLADVYLPDHSTRNRSLRDHRKPLLEMRLAEALGAAGDRLDALGLRRASNLRERCLVDGLPQLGDATAGAVSTEDTELNWLPLVLLTLAAHGGANPRGPATDAWRNAMTQLRGTLVRRCGSLAVELMDSDQVVARSDPRAHWLPDDRVLMLCHDAKYDELASASQAILERQDLLKDLRLVLGALVSAAPEPTGKQIDAALDRAEIDGGAVADIRHRWFGATTLLIDRIRPVLELLAIPRAGLNAAASDTQTLKAWLAVNLPTDDAARLPPERLISAASRSRDDIEMGRATFRRLGEVAQLPRWNDALAELGDRYVMVTNSEAADQAKRHIEEAAPYLRALARHVAIETGAPDLFRKLEEVTESFEAPADWSTRWWEVPLDAVLKALHTAYTHGLDVPSHLLEALDETNTAGGPTSSQPVGAIRLHAALADRGIAIGPDPYDIYRGNENRLGRDFGEVHALHQAWLEVCRAGANPPRPEAFEPPQMDATAYLRTWSNEERFRRALRAIDDADFRTQCEGCATLEDAVSKLGLSPEAVEDARRKRRERRRRAEQAKRTFDIAGKLFEVDGAESYGELLDRLETLPEPEGPPARSNEPTRLVQPGPNPTPSSTPRRQPPGRTSHLYSSPHLPGLVGIVGEMHAWRYLRSQFGTQVVTPAAWVSENGLKVLRPAGSEKRNASDSYGFDFRFHCDGFTWHFEVKATTEDDTNFSLPPSEIRAATRLANSHPDRWRILRIRRALTDSPEIDLLPNPFETGFSDLFRLSSGGMTVRYALNADP